jgi:hypothetical protein
MVGVGVDCGADGGAPVVVAAVEGLVAVVVALDTDAAFGSSPAEQPSSGSDTPARTASRVTRFTS